jgi:hypothetical protein
MISGLPLAGGETFKDLVKARVKTVIDSRRKEGERVIERF